MQSVNVEDFIEYPYWETDCPNCGGKISTEDEPNPDGVVRCSECLDWFKIESEDE